MAISHDIQPYHDVVSDDSMKDNSVWLLNYSRQIKAPMHKIFKTLNKFIFANNVYVMRTAD